MYSDRVCDIYIGCWTESIISSFLELRSPEGKVIPDELHDGGGILVLLLFDLINVSDGIVEGFLGKLASLSWIILDLIVEHGVVEGETKSDGVSGLEFGLSDGGGFLVGFMGLFAGLVVGGAGGEFGDVPVVVSLHFVVKDLGFGVGGLGDELAVNEIKDLVAVFVELTLNLGFVTSEESEVL